MANDYSRVDDYSIIERKYIIELEGNRFCIGESDLIDRLEDIKVDIVDIKGIENALTKAGFRVSKVYNGESINLQPSQFFEKNNYYLIGILAKRSAFKDFKQLQLPSKVKEA